MPVLVHSGLLRLSELTLVCVGVEARVFVDDRLSAEVA